jgi:hypothetical protein
MSETDIIIHEPVNHFAKKLFQGTRWRYPSMTDVKFISDTQIVAAHRYACKVYLIRLGASGHVIEDTLVIKHGGKLHQTEAFVVMNDVIYMISFSNILTMIDILPNHTLQKRAEVILSSSNVPFHGIAIHHGLVYVTPSKTSAGTEYITTLDPLTNHLSHVATLGDTVRVKGLTFLPSGQIVVIINYKTPTSLVQPGHMFDGAIRLYSPEFTLLDTMEMPSTHFDGIVSNGDRFYATGADLHGGYIIVGTVLHDKLGAIRAVPVHDFPHGIDLRNGKVAYTSYKTSGVHFIGESDLDVGSDPHGA